MGWNKFIIVMLNYIIPTDEKNGDRNEVIDTWPLLGACFMILLPPG